MKKDDHARLTIEHRHLIEIALDGGDSFSAVARRIGFDTSTVPREVKRNRRYDGKSSRDRNDRVHLDGCKRWAFAMMAACGGAAAPAAGHAWPSATATNRAIAASSSALHSSATVAIDMLAASFIATSAPPRSLTLS